METTKVFLFFYFVHSVTCVLRITKADCESYNKSWVTIENCRLKAISREISKFYLNLTILHPANDIWIHLVTVKRGTGGFKTFLGNDVTFDACEYVMKKNNPIINLIYHVFKKFSTVNHTCPYNGTQVVDGVYLDTVLYPLPLPNGEYGLWALWQFNKKINVINADAKYDKVLGNSPHKNMIKNK